MMDGGLGGGDVCGRGMGRGWDGMEWLGGEWRCGDMIDIEIGRDGSPDGVGGCRESDGVPGLGVGWGVMWLQGGGGGGGGNDCMR